MNSDRFAFLLLTSKLGNPDRKPLTISQLQFLSRRMRAVAAPSHEGEITAQHLTAIGISGELSERILYLLSETDLLQNYLARAQRFGVYPVCRNSPDYPRELRQKLGDAAPGCLWMKGNLQIMQNRKISLVGSRDLNEPNRRFASEVGKQAVCQGFTLVSGNARGADRQAQESCLQSGGQVISVIADDLRDRPYGENILYISEEDFDERFSSYRALRRNRIIHALGEIVLVAQCALEKGGTWDGTVHNLSSRWSPVFCCQDGSEAVTALSRMGAETITEEELRSIDYLTHLQLSMFE